MLPILENTLTVDVDVSKRISKDSMDGSVVEPFDEILSAEAAKSPLNIDPVSPGAEMTPLSSAVPVSLQAELNTEPTDFYAKTALIEPAPTETPLTILAEAALPPGNAVVAERGQVDVDGNILRTGGKGLPVLSPDEVVFSENNEDSDLVDGQVAALGVYPASTTLPPAGVLAKVNDFLNLKDQRYADSIPSRGRASVLGSQEASILTSLTTKAAVRPDAPGFSVAPSEALPVATEKFVADTSFLRLDSDPSALKQPTIASTQPLIGSVTLPFGGLEGSPSLKMSGPQVMGGSQVLSASPGDPQWNSDLAGRVSVMVKNGLSEASLQLTPPELGRLEVKIVTEGDQAKINFVVHSADAKDAIELAMPRLRDMLGQVGLQLAQGEVADHSQSRQGGNPVSDSSSELSANDLEESPDQSVTNFSVRETTGLVDYYV